MLAATVNPLMPAGYDLLWTVVLVATFALTATALWQALRSPAHTGGQQLLWAAVIVVAPVAGALAWFVLRSPLRQRAAKRADGSSVG